MSVAGYLGKNMKELQLPRGCADDLGVHYGGADEERKTEKDKRDEEVYESVADYDPVLRAHCRI